MLARLTTLLPFAVAIPQGEEFPTRGYDDQGYSVTIYPPIKTDQPFDGLDEIKINDVPAVEVNGLRIDFQKESLNRTMGGPHDPPDEVVVRAINSFLIPLRHAVRAFHVNRTAFPECVWHIAYLNDDGSELEPKEGFIRTRGTLHHYYRWTAFNRNLWNVILDWGPGYKPPAWEELLLDAFDELPAIGPAIVLGATALEVLISGVLDELAKRSTVPPDLWAWLNKRQQTWQDPSVADEYDVLLKALAGHSLKEEVRLWEGFSNLKNARNSFVHKGVAKIGEKLVDVEITLSLLRSAWEIAAKIRSWIPDDVRWPEWPGRDNLRVETFKRVTNSALPR